MAKISVSYQPNKIKKPAYTAWIDGGKFCTTDTPDGNTTAPSSGLNLIDAFDVDWSAYTIDGKPADATTIINKLVGASTGRGITSIALKSGSDVSPGTTSVYVITYTDNTTSEISIYNGTNGINGANGSDGVTPKLKIEDGQWFVSYDNEESWEEVGLSAATNDDIAAIFLSENPDTDDTTLNV